MMVIGYVSNPDHDVVNNLKVKCLERKVKEDVCAELLKNHGFH
jgi:hypothetical protein